MTRVLDWIQKKLPESGLLENVEGLGFAAAAGEKSARDLVIERLQSMGYAADWRVIDLSHHMACCRKRHILLCTACLTLFLAISFVPSRSYGWVAGSDLMPFFSTRTVYIWFVSDEIGGVFTLRSMLKTHDDSVSQIMNRYVPIPLSSLILSLEDFLQRNEVNADCCDETHQAKEAPPKFHVEGQNVKM
eukprot:5550319-Amphidinium_carterae.4